MHELFSSIDARLFAPSLLPSFPPILLPNPSTLLYCSCFAFSAAAALASSRFLAIIFSLCSMNSFSSSFASCCHLALYSACSSKRFSATAKVVTKKEKGVI
jgi:hypothetical protein